VQDELEPDSVVVPVAVAVAVWSGPMTKGGNPSGGGMFPPDLAPGPGTSTIPTSTLTNQIGRTVVWPSADVVVWEWVLRPGMMAVLVANVAGVELGGSFVSGLLRVLLVCGEASPLSG